MLPNINTKLKCLISDGFIIHPGLFLDFLSSNINWTMVWVYEWNMKCEAVPCVRRRSDERRPAASLCWNWPQLMCILCSVGVTPAGSMRGLWANIWKRCLFPMMLLLMLRRLLWLWLYVWERERHDCNEIILIGVTLDY